MRQVKEKNSNESEIRGLLGEMKDILKKENKGNLFSEKIIVDN